MVERAGGWNLLGLRDPDERVPPLRPLKVAAARQLPPAGSHVGPAIDMLLKASEAELARAEGRTYETAEEMLARVTSAAQGTAKRTGKGRRRAG